MPLAMARMFSTDPQKNFFVDRDDRELMVRARLKPGTTRRQAGNELAVLARSLEREYPKTNRDRGAAVRTMFEMRTQDGDLNWKFGVIFTVLAVVVLLVACTNAAGLLLSRARTRTREIAVRLAIGAGRFRLIRLLLTESLLLALLGGLGGIAVGYTGIHLLSKFRIPAELPVKIPFRMDTRVLLASLAFSVLSALICGLAPALQSTRLDLVKGLKSAEGDVPGRKRLWGRNALVVAQIAMSLMLLAASFLMFRGFQHSLGEGLEFAAQARDHVLMVSFDPRLVQYDASQTERFYRLLGERVRQAPGVRSAAFTQNPPLALNDFERIAFVPGGLPDAARSREFPVADGHRRRGVFRDDGGTDPARPRLPGVRYRGDAARRRRQRAVREALLAGRRPGGQAHPPRERERRPGRDRRRRADDQVRRRPRRAERFRVPAVRAASRRRAWSSWSARTAIPRSSSARSRTSSAPSMPTCRCSRR